MTAPPPAPAAGDLPRLPAATPVDARPAAIVDGHRVLWGELRSALSDAAGAEVLQDLILDRHLERAAAEAGLEITDADRRAEEQRLIEALGAEPRTATRLLEELRDRRRLGPRRYRALLRRNAVLRALVRERVTLSEAAIRQMYDRRHGPHRQVRLLTTRDLATAQAMLKRLRGGAFFGDLAVEASTDSSAARGGLLEPVSEFDPSYPPALRLAIWTLEKPGDVSDPVLLESGYAIVQLVREIDGDGTPREEARDEIEKLVRLAQERVLMDRLARQIIAGTQVTIFDEALHASWQRFERMSR